MNINVSESKYIQKMAFGRCERGAIEIDESENVQDIKRILMLES